MIENIFYMLSEKDQTSLQTAIGIIESTELPALLRKEIGFMVCNQADSYAHGSCTEDEMLTKAIQAVTLREFMRELLSIASLTPLDSNE